MNLAHLLTTVAIMILGASRPPFGWLAFALGLLAFLLVITDRPCLPKNGD